MSAFAATGVPLHFSGHLHVNDTARHAGGFVNVAVPSPVGYGPGLKIIDLHADRFEIRTVPLRQVPGHDLAFSAYRAEAARARLPVPPASVAADHGEFVSRHLVELVHRRYMPREWPRGMVDFVQEASVADLLARLGVPADDAAGFPLHEFVEDWYRLRKAGELAEADIAPERLAFYRRLCAAAPATGGDGLAAQFSTLLHMMRAYLGRLPNRDFTVHLPDLAVTPL